MNGEAKQLLQGFNRIKQGELLLYEFDDRIEMTDMNLASIIRCCVPGTECTQAIPDEHKPSRFRFILRGNIPEMKMFIEKFFKPTSLEEMKSHKEQLREFTQIQKHMKGLIDEARTRIIRV